MIHYLLILIFSISYVTSQTSSLALYGFGEKISSYDANTVSLGDLRLFSSTTDGFILSAPSTFYKNNSTNLSMSIGFNDIKTDYITNMSSNNFHHFSFGFPITDNQYFLLAFNPIYRSSIVLQEADYTFIGANETNLDTNGDNIDDPVAYKTIYDFNGGISEISSSLSSKISDKISLGLKFGALFGSSLRIHNLNYYPVGYDVNGDLIDPKEYSNQINWSYNEIREVNHTYSSFSYLIDFRLKIPNDNELNNIFALYYGQSENLKIKVDFDNMNSSSSDNEVYILNGYRDYGIGFNYKQNYNLGYMLEIQKFDSFSASNITDIFHNPSRDIISFHLGMYYKINQFKSSKINLVSFNYGFYKKTHQLINTEKINDYGITFGTGINYLNNNSLGLSFQIGKRNSEFNEFKNEKYFRFILTLVSNSNWFIKERD